MSSEVSSASPKLPMWTSSGSSFAVSSSISASAASTSRKPVTSISGRRSAARIGGSTALSTPTSAATTKAAPGRSMVAPGTIQTDTATAAAATTQASRKPDHAEPRCLGRPAHGLAVADVLGGHVGHGPPASQPRVGDRTTAPACLSAGGVPPCADQRPSGCGVSGSRSSSRRSSRCGSRTSARARASSKAPAIGHPRHIGHHERQDDQGRGHEHGGGQQGGAGERGEDGEETYEDGTAANRHRAVLPAGAGTDADRA